MGDLIALIERAGFADAAFVGETGVATSRYTKGAAFYALKKRREE